jgi:hypothetical protein
MPQQVKKMLSPEEMTLLANLKTIIQELEGLQEGGEQETEAPAEMSLSNKELMAAIKKLTENNNLGDSTEQMGEEEDKPKKAMKENNGPTANENAEDRNDNQTDINDENLTEVGKALLQLLEKNKRPVTKSNNIDAISQAVVKAITPLTKKIQQIEQFNSNMLDALGFANNIEKSLKVDQQQVQKGLNNVNSQSAPVQTLDATAVVNKLVEVIKSQAVQNNNQQGQYRNDWNGMQKARKDLQDSLPFIFQNSKK